MVVMLRKYEEMPIQSLPMGMTLNTMIALLTTGIRSMLLICVFEGISQWKWAWFRTSRPIDSFQIFDDASRGLWGSFALMFHLRFKHIAALGAFVCITSVAMSLGAQQLISYGQMLTDVDESATAGLSLSHWSSYQGFERDIQSNLDAAVVRAALSRAFEQEPFGLSCSTASCRFPDYSSIAVCYTVHDIIKHVTITQYDETLDANPSPGFGISIDSKHSFTLPHPNFVYVTELNQSLYNALDADSSRSTIINLAIIAATEDKFYRHAVQLVFFLCVNTYATSVVNATSARRIVSSYERPTTLDSGNACKSNDTSTCERRGQGVVEFDYAGKQYSGSLDGTQAMHRSLRLMTGAWSWSETDTKADGLLAGGLAWLSGNHDWNATTAATASPAENVATSLSSL